MRFSARPWRVCRAASSTSCRAGRRPDKRWWSRRRRGRLHRIGGGGPRDRPAHARRSLRPPRAHGDGRQEPAIVTASADLEAAAEGVARSAFGLSGQKCSACSRAIVFAEIHAFWSGSRPRRPGWRSATRRPRRVRGPRDQRGQREALRERGRRPRARGAGGRRRRAAGPPRALRGARPSSPACPAATHWSAMSSSSRRDGHPRGLVRGGAGRGQRAGVRAHRRDLLGGRDEQERFLAEIQAGVVYVNRRAGATTGAWPGTQTFCGWKSSGSTGKGGLGPWYLPQFMREQSRTIVR